jgi:hypothetical protein
MVMEMGRSVLAVFILFVVKRGLKVCGCGQAQGLFLNAVALFECFSLEL